MPSGASDARVAVRRDLTPSSVPAGRTRSGGPGPDPVTGVAGVLMVVEANRNVMLGERVAAYRRRAGDGLEAAFSEDLPPRDIAASFSFGVFLAALPNFGIALVVFAALAYAVDRVSKLALVAAVFVMNPLAKWAVYAASFWLGSRLLGPVEGASVSSLSLSIGQDVLFRLVVGNVLISVALGVVGYVAARRFIRVLDARDIEVVETVADSLSDGTQ